MRSRARSGVVAGTPRWPPGPRRRKLAPMSTRDQERSTMTTTTGRPWFHNVETGEVGRTLLSPDDGKGDRLESELWLRPGAAVVGAHVHPALAERFEVARRPRRLPRRRAQTGGRAGNGRRDPRRRRARLVERRRRDRACDRPRHPGTTVHRADRGALQPRQQRPDQTRRDAGAAVGRGGRARVPRRDPLHAAAARRPVGRLPAAGRARPRARPRPARPVAARSRLRRRAARRARSRSWPPSSAWRRSRRRALRPRRGRRSARAPRSRPASAADPRRPVAARSPRRRAGSACRHGARPRSRRPCRL